MTPEDRLRHAITARTERVEPSADALPTIEEKLMHARRDDNRHRVLLGLGAAAAVIAVVVAAVVITRDDSSPVATDGGTSSTTTSEATTTTEPSTTEVPFQGVDPAVPVFPDPTTSQRFDSPKAVATAFATDLAGFSAPVVGEFQPGDSRSGEVEVRPFAAGAATVVLVRQLEDDTWFVIGATTDSIRLTAPTAGATIATPQPLLGMAYAFEGVVNVQLYVDGTQAAIAETVVTGRGDGVLGDFAGELQFTNDTKADHGVLLLKSLGGKDGSTIAATVIRVAL